MPAPIIMWHSKLFWTYTWERTLIEHDDISESETAIFSWFQYAACNTFDTKFFFYLLTDAQENCFKGILKFTLNLI